MGGVEGWVLGLAGRPETFVVVAALLTAGAVVTMLPTQSLVVAVGALLIARGDPALPLVLLAAASVIGMLTGDLIAWRAARLVLALHHGSARRLPWLARPLQFLERRVDSFRNRYERDPLVTTAVGRLLPTGRLATDLLAADRRVPPGPFVARSLLGAAVFTAFCLLLAGLAGPLVRQAPLAVTAGAIVVSLLAGSAIDAVDGRLHRRPGRAPAARGTMDR